MIGLGSINCIKHNSLGAVADYDRITIGGSVYTVNQIIDKVITANSDLTAYSSPGGTVLFKIAKGQPIGKVYSYIRPDQAKDGRAWLMFEKTYNNFYYVPADNTSSSALSEQGALTVAEELAAEKERKEKENEPVTYYFKKLVVPVLVGGGVVVLASSIGKEYVKGKLSQPKKEPALSGHKRKKK
jgi:hypothetical protein